MDRSGTINLTVTYIAMELDMDGMIHITGQCCSTSRCGKCGGRRHMQGTALGYMDACEVCDADRWEPPLTYITEDDSRIIVGRR